MWIYVDKISLRKSKPLLRKLPKNFKVTIFFWNSKRLARKLPQKIFGVGIVFGRTLWYCGTTELPPQLKCMQSCAHLRQSTTCHFTSVTSVQDSLNSADRRWRDVTASVQSPERISNQFPLQFFLQRRRKIVAHFEIIFHSATPYTQCIRSDVVFSSTLGDQRALLPRKSGVFVISRRISWD